MIGNRPIDHPVVARRRAEAFARRMGVEAGQRYQDNDFTPGKGGSRVFRVLAVVPVGFEPDWRIYAICLAESKAGRKVDVFRPRSFLIRADRLARERSWKRGYSLVRGRAPSPRPGTVRSRWIS